MDEKTFILLAFTLFGLSIFIYPTPLMHFWNQQFGKDKEGNVVRPLIVRSVGLVFMFISLTFLMSF